MSVFSKLFGLCNDDDDEPRHDAPPPAPKVIPPDFLFGFFYCDMPQIAETASFVNYCHIPYTAPAGIEMAIAAAAAGKRVILSVEDCGFTARRYIGGADAKRNLFSVLSALGGALGSVIALYTIDEPNIGLSIPEQDLTSFCDDCRFVFNRPLAVIYSGNNGERPAIYSHDWVGIDDYGKGIGVIQQYDRLNLRPYQRTIYVPLVAELGSDQRQYPQPWLDAVDERCVAIAAFDYCGFDGKPNGLRDGPDDLKLAWAEAGKRFGTPAG